MLRVAVMAALLLSACGTSGSPSAVTPAGANDPAPAPNSKGLPDKNKKPQAKPGASETKKPAPVKPDPAEAPARRPRRHLVAVTRVVDGDTIEVGRHGGTEDVRLIGIDTPETVHPSMPVECFGPRASSFTSSALLGEKVRLEFDDERRDHYGRLLAYVWLDGRLFNEVLVARGYAEVTIYYPNDAHEDELFAAQSRARSSDRGAWGACPAGGGGGGSSPEDKAAPPAGGSNCDANYEGACIPVYPPDVDCDDVSATDFRSVGTDPHGFDADGDGVACEG